MENKLEVLCHSSIKITGEKIIYFDPFKINKNYQDADYIFCTHSHYDHFSPEDIIKVKNENTIIITVESSRQDALKLFKDENKVFIVEPGKSYKIDDIEFETTYAYNKNKPFHPKDNKWVGYILTLNNVKYYIAGDTDNIEEIQNISCDFALIPIGGTYTMDYKEAAELANTICATTIIPTHYGSIVGEKEDGVSFQKLVKNKQVKLLI